MTSEDWIEVSWLGTEAARGKGEYTFPTAASPKSTSLTLLLGFGCADGSAIVRCVGWIDRGYDGGDGGVGARKGSEG